MPIMRAAKTFKIDRDRSVLPGDLYDCTESVARHHEALAYATRHSEEFDLSVREAA